MKRDSLDALFSTYIRARAKQTCERCGKTYPPKSRGLHCAHVFSRGKQCVRFEPINAVCLCRGCHVYFDQHKESQFYPWYIAKYGQAQFDLLRLRANLPKKPDRIAIAIQLRFLIKELEAVA